MERVGWLGIPMSDLQNGGPFHIKSALALQFVRWRAVGAVGAVGQWLKTGASMRE